MKKIKGLFTNQEFDMFCQVYAISNLGEKSKESFLSSSKSIQDMEKKFGSIKHRRSMSLLQVKCVFFLISFKHVPSPPPPFFFSSVS